MTVTMFSDVRAGEFEPEKIEASSTAESAVPAQ